MVSPQSHEWDTTARVGRPFHGQLGSANRPEVSVRSVAQSYLALCETVDCSMPCLPLSPTPEACSKSCSLSRWCHPTISSSVVPFSSSPQTFPASASFRMSQFFASGGQSIGVSTLASVILEPKKMKSFTNLFYFWRLVVWNQLYWAIVKASIDRITSFSWL